VRPTADLRLIRRRPRQPAVGGLLDDATDLRETVVIVEHLDRGRRARRMIVDLRPAAVISVRRRRGRANDERENRQAQADNTHVW
jgi:hypothetical protein